MHGAVVILDYGSQYTQLITRRVRELGIFSVILPANIELERLKTFKPRAVVLSGGPSSVYDAGAPALPNGFLEYQKQEQFPVLGICYGMQLLARDLGGEVKRAESREYGRMRVLAKSSAFFGAEIRSFEAWMSHGDETVRVPAGFKETARSESGALAAFENPTTHFYGLQFHPEVTHTENGRELLGHFLTKLAGLKADWNMRSVLEEQVEKIQGLVKPGQHVLCALSGGVDSAVAATLVHKAIGDRLHCVFVDHGLLRFNERERMQQLFNQSMHLPVRIVDASKRFLGELQGVTDPEKKRKIIGAEFIRAFDEAALVIGKEIGSIPAFLVQGTLYPDVIESSAGHLSAATIKSHHNVGGLPKDLKFQLVEPLRELFKDEVRALGRELGVPVDFLRRHPFPGPGLAVRIIGEITPERLEILRQVDEIFIESLHQDGLYEKIWQAFAVFLPIKSVGVQGDGRTHDHVVALRAVTSSDGMTADWYPFEPQFLAKVSSKICNEVRGVNRVVYDISSKPPATIEWE
ncbi:MAG TPA: GMP synthase (glutamine-hydrolyzing) [Bdellovibrionales bacterium]|nr:MAG: glutamine-hydrolyzing GMP synthase [Bdellovibrionales bacterium GWB1_52_6]OFZ03136.1 MAG: glutamine-hydrolyzing GMP synthase [Bdellovibrionales bacterium GWA1_52_35]OFZ36842.1 MAG: glutamine-hydrolyzing GMP synthase [Bdellovibrionales bacterium GWC1_52_8]HAR42454.1 GMP synthase (glutamine-hydrolyzing) [Bdellovibrionales bacterium]HCM40445.1 GMP synthase (glutamine-hydrolyzing) [Bdellovibrionales bacterium]